VKNREKIVKFPVWGNYRIRVIVTADVKKYMAEHNSFCEVCMDEDQSDTNAVTLHRLGQSIIIFPAEADMDTIAHESYHAIRQMLVSRDAELDNEVVAYHLGYLVNKVFDLVWE
jgi:hypothetical protein